MTTPDKDIHQKLKNWYNETKADLIAKAPLIDAYAKTGELDESLLPIIAGIDLARPDSDVAVETEIDTTTGEVLGTRVLKDDVSDETETVSVEDSAERLLLFKKACGKSYLEIAEQAGFSSAEVSDYMHGRKPLGEETVTTLVNAIIMSDTPETAGEQTRSEAEGEHIIKKAQVHDHGGKVFEGDVWRHKATQGDRKVDWVGVNRFTFEGIYTQLAIADLLGYYTLTTPSHLRQQQDKQDGETVEDDTGNEEGSEANTTQTEVSGSDTQSEVEEIEDQQEDQFIVGDVVIASVENEVLGNLVIIKLDDLVHVEDSKGHEWSFEYNDISLVSRTDIPKPEGDGWYRNTGTPPDVEMIADLWWESGERSGVEHYVNEIDWDLDHDDPFAWYKLKEQHSEQETIVEGSQESNQEMDGECASAERHAEPTKAGPSSEGQSSSDPKGLQEETEGADVDLRHKFILENEWQGIVDGLISIEEDGTVLCALVDDAHDGRAHSIEYFLLRFTPKGWERFNPDFDYDTRPDDLFDILFADGEHIVEIEGMGVQALETKPIFIREHKEQEASRMGPDDFKTMSFKGNGPFVPIEEFERMTNDEWEEKYSKQEAELEEVQAIQGTQVRAEENTESTGSVRADTENTRSEIVGGTISQRLDARNQLDQPNQQAVELVEGAQDETT